MVAGGNVPQNLKFARGKFGMGQRFGEFCGDRSRKQRFSLRNSPDSFENLLG
jgi:hypothetical protein